LVEAVIETARGRQRRRGLWPQCRIKAPLLPHRHSDDGD
jgi:hypothetical protein